MSGVICHAQLTCGCGQRMCSILGLYPSSRGHKAFIPLCCYLTNIMTAYSSVPCLSSTARIVVSERFVCLFRVLTAVTVLKYISDMYARDGLIPERKMRRHWHAAAPVQRVIYRACAPGRTGRCCKDTSSREKGLGYVLGCAASILYLTRDFSHLLA